MEERTEASKNTLSHSPTHPSVHAMELGAVVPLGTQGKQTQLTLQDEETREHVVDNDCMGGWKSGKKVELFESRTLHQKPTNTVCI